MENANSDYNGNTMYLVRKNIRIIGNPNTYTFAKI